jgi:hypothetical protein
MGACGPLGARRPGAAFKFVTVALRLRARASARAGKSESESLAGRQLASGRAIRARGPACDSESDAAGTRNDSEAEPHWLARIIRVRVTEGPDRPAPSESCDSESDAAVIESDRP